MQKIGNDVWFAAFGGAFLYDPQHNRAVRVQGINDNVEQIVLVNKEVWLATDHSAFRYDAQQNRAVPIEGWKEHTNTPNPIAVVDNEVWFAGLTAGAFRYDLQQKRAVPVDQATVEVNQFALVNNEVWIASTFGTFRYDSEHNRAIPVEGTPQFPRRISVVDNQIWFAAQGGAFRYEPSGHVSIELKSPGSWITHLLGSRFSLPGNASFELSNSTSFKPSGKTEVILASNSKDLHENEKTQLGSP